MSYKIVRRFFKNSERTLIKTGLTLEEAQEHCSDPETSSKTATEPGNQGPWFDAYEEETYHDRYTTDPEYANDKSLSRALLGCYKEGSRR